MTIAVTTRILFFGRIADRFGAERDVDIPESGCTIAELKAILFAGEDMADAGAILAALDQEMVDDAAEIRPGQEIAFFSPLSGG